MEERVYNYIQEFGSITTRQAFVDLGCTRLSEYIRRLRLKYDIDDEIETGFNRYGEKIHWKKYFLRNKEDN